MNANYTEIGIATAKGMYKGKDAIFVVQEFGRPSLIARSTGVASTSVDALVTLVSSRENDIKKATTAKPVTEVATRTTVSTTPTPITAGETSTLEATYFDMINWARNPLENVTYVINGVESQSADGKFQITWQPNTTYSISVKKSGFVNSDGVTVTSGSLPVTQPDNFNLQSAVNFVKNALNEGTLTDMVSDWSLISAGTYKDDADFLNKAKEIASKDFGTFNSVTDVERKAMALMSLGIKPWEGKADLIKTLLTYFDGTQFGSKDIVNDDIFALIVLNKSGFLTNDDEIKNSIKEILSFQKPNGSWDSVDMTSASIQALSPFINQTEVATALLKAKQNLKDSQKPNGSFGNPFATTWAIQAIRALGENPKDWIKEGKNRKL
jgi:hypothetical protein